MMAITKMANRLKISINADVSTTIDLLKLANYYCETRLRNECETLIKQSITIDNASRLYASAISYNAKVVANNAISFR